MCISGHRLRVPGGEHRWGCVVKRRVWSLLVIIFNPGGDLDAVMRRAEEQRLVRQFFAHATIEALAEAVLQRLPWRDVMPFRADLPTMPALRCWSARNRYC